MSKFSEEILEHIARIVASSRTGTEITRFFKAAGYPEFVHDGATKWCFVLECLQKLNEKQDGPSHVIKVVEKLADPKQYIANPGKHKEIIDSINQAIIFNGFKIDQNNKVVISNEPIPTTPPANADSQSVNANFYDELFKGVFSAKENSSCTPEIDAFDRIKLHPKIREVSHSLFKDGHYAHAIFEAFKAVNNAVKRKSGVNDRDGQSLMAFVFSGDSPLIALNSLLSQSDKDEQEGFKFLFMGSMTGIRNPKAHEHIRQTDPYRTLHYLAFASLLMARLDEATKTR